VCYVIIQTSSIWNTRLAQCVSDSQNLRALGEVIRSRRVNLRYTVQVYVNLGEIKVWLGK
jgi:hypothetical protein